MVGAASYMSRDAYISPHVCQSIVHTFRFPSLVERAHIPRESISACTSLLPLPSFPSSSFSYSASCLLPLASRIAPRASATRQLINRPRFAFRVHRSPILSLSPSFFLLLCFLDFSAGVPLSPLFLADPRRTEPGPLFLLRMAAPPVPSSPILHRAARHPSLINVI